MILRTIAFICLLLVGYGAPFWLFLILALAYLTFYEGYELLILAGLIDIQFGTHGVLLGYLYTLSVGITLIISILVKPSIRFSSTRP